MQLKKVMISSTMLDLPEHREEVRDACLRQGAFPVMMEHLPAQAEAALEVSLGLVDQASVYLGIFAHRYGYVPPGHHRSITEMEYRRAGELGLPRLIFLMGEDHLIKASDVEQGSGAAKLQALKEEMLSEHVVGSFNSKEDLRGQVIDSLSHLQTSAAPSFHFVSDIPQPPKPYVAHPYVLLETGSLVGRQQELNLLTDWVANPEAEAYRARVLCLVAIGGMGKSALTWKWFTDVAQHEMKPLAGRLWWSFYESDATFENFVIRALAYVTGASRSDVQAISAPEREEQLLNILNREPYLLVLDGLERIMVAYARMDAATLADDDLDEKAENFVVSEEVGSGRGRHRLRKTSDPRAGAFLRKLAQAPAARILISTRLYPAELQTTRGTSLPGVDAHFLSGLRDDDALELWRSFGVSGSREALKPLFNSLDNYPLLIRALAGEVAQYRPAPGDFDLWRKDHSDFDPYALPLLQRKSHVLSFALRGLDPDRRKLLVTLAGFRMPATYRTVVALVTGPGRPFATQGELDVALTELEDRGLVGWDRRANRYDLHPVVRGVTWRRLGRVGQRIIYENLQSYFEALPSPDQQAVRGLDDLTSAIELYHTLVGLERYDEAWDIFEDHLHIPVLVRWSLCRQGAEWLEQLFPAGPDQLPPLSQPKTQRWALWNLGYAYHYSGREALAVSLWQRANEYCGTVWSGQGLVPDWGSLAVGLIQIGALFEAEEAAKRDLAMEKTAYSRAIARRSLAHLRSLRGQAEEAADVFRRSLGGFQQTSGVKYNDEHEPYAMARAARNELCLGNLEEADELSLRGWKLAEERQLERPILMARNVRGAYLLACDRLEEAQRLLQESLLRARRIHYVLAELDAVCEFLELFRRQGRIAAARELLEDVQELMDRGPYRLVQATALRVLARIEAEHGSRAAAVAAATEAYRQAWCDGPPYAFHWELEASREILQELGAAVPDDLPPFQQRTDRYPSEEN